MCTTAEELASDLVVLCVRGPECGSFVTFTTTQAKKSRPARDKIAVVVVNELLYAWCASPSLRHAKLVFMASILVMTTVVILFIFMQ